MDTAAVAATAAEAVPSFEEMLSHGNTVFAVLTAGRAAPRLLYVSPNAREVLGIEPTAVLGCVHARNPRSRAFPWCCHDFAPLRAARAPAAQRRA